jgi:type II secretory pathway component PulF
LRFHFAPFIFNLRWMIFTPGQLSRRAELYHQLSQFTTTGIGVIRALEQIRANPPSPSFRVPVQKMLDELNKGATVAESLRRVGWLPAFDTALVEAGERSGRLDASFRALADYYNDRASIAKQVLANLAYPLFLFHFAVLVFLVVLPFAASHFNASPVWLLARAALVLLPFYAAVVLIIYANQGRHGEKWRSFMETVLNFVPRLGSARRSLALSRLAMALEALINAGVNIGDAWDLAATASGSPALKRAVSPLKSQIDAGRTPAEVVRANRVFPEMFVNFYSSGEISGRLDDSLRQLHNFYQEDGSRKLQGFAQWMPRFFYLLIMGVIAYEIVKFYMGYFNQVNGVLNGF